MLELVVADVSFPELLTAVRLAFSRERSLASRASRGDCHGSSTNINSHVLIVGNDSVSQ
jgi:hypothetical protein